ncbi:MAG: prevent-host-death protein [Pseudomonadota bacterium]
MVHPHEQVDEVNDSTRFGEIVRRLRVNGPQHISLRDGGEVVVIDAEEYRKLKSKETGVLLINALRSCPDPDVDLAPERSVMPISDVSPFSDL